MKVLHVISDLRRGGRERQLAILSSYSNPVIENHIIAFHKADQSYVEEYELKIKYTKQGKISRIMDICKYVKEKKINLIHSWGNYETLYSVSAAKLCKVPLLNGSIRHGVRKNSFAHRFRSIVLRFSKYILANSYEGFKANKIKIDNSKHFVVYNGIEEKFFTSFNKERRKEFNLEIKLPQEAIVFISIANFIPYKDYKTILMSLSEINRNDLSFHYIIIGKGPLLNETKNLIKSLRLEKNVSIYSDNPNIPTLLSISDIMIHSSLGEGCSNAILEASASGLIVVASDTGGTKEIINEWDFLYQYKNVDELTSRIKDAIKLLRNDSLLHHKIQEVTRDMFSVESLVNNYTMTVNTILNYHTH